MPKTDLRQTCLTHSFFCLIQNSGEINLIRRVNERTWPRTHLGIDAASLISGERERMMAAFQLNKFNLD